MNAYVRLCKLRVVLVMLVTSYVGMILATQTMPTFSLVFYALLGIGLCSASAAAVNHIIDVKIDTIMSRTQRRPLVKEEVTTSNALLFAFALAVIGSCILFFKVNLLTTILTFLALIGYAVIYTMFLKRATPQNIVIGGLAGAVPPLLGWTAVTNSVQAEALILVLIIFAWTPPHFLGFSCL